MKKEITIEMDGKRYPATIKMPDGPNQHEPWKPEGGDAFYVITEHGEVKRICCRGEGDVNTYYWIGNVYPTRQLADKAVELMIIKTKFTRRRIEIEGPSIQSDNLSHSIDPGSDNFPYIAHPGRSRVYELFVTKKETTARQLINEMQDDIVRAFQLMKELKNAGCVV